MKSDTGWNSILQSTACTDLAARVNALREQGERIYPPQRDVFRAFDECPFDKVRVVILGQDPYAREGQAIGRAFAVPESTKTPPSLKNIFKEVQRDYPSGLLPTSSLKAWAEQGVFLLNTTLTVAEGRSNSHAKFGWTDAVKCRH